MSHQGYIDHTTRKPVFLGVAGIGALAVLCLFLLDGFVRLLADEPQMHETHVRYVWQTKSGKKECIIAVRSKQAEACSSFSKEDLKTFRLHREKPSPRILAGNF